MQSLRAEMEAYLERLTSEKRLQDSTIRIYRLELEELLRLLQNGGENSALKKLKGLAPATHARKRLIWRNFLLACPPPWNKVLSDSKAPKIRSREPRFLNEPQAFQLESAAYKSRHPLRDRLFLLLGLELGLRLREILSLRFGDIDGEWLKIVRKGGNEQRLPLTPRLQILLRMWKEECRGLPDDFIFEGKSGRPMTSRAGQKLMKRLLKLSGLDSAYHPHALRHTFATRLASRGVSLATLKELLGHRQIRTTERYLHVTPEHLKEALAFLKNSELK